MHNFLPINFISNMLMIIHSNLYYPPEDVKKLMPKIMQQAEVNYGNQI